MGGGLAFLLKVKSQICVTKGITIKKKALSFFSLPGGPFYPFCIPFFLTLRLFHSSVFPPFPSCILPSWSLIELNALFVAGEEAFLVSISFSNCLINSNSCPDVERFFYCFTNFGNSLPFPEIALSLLLICYQRREA